MKTKYKQTINGFKIPANSLVEHRGALLCPKPSNFKVDTPVWSAAHKCQIILPHESVDFTLEYERDRIARGTLGAFVDMKHEGEVVA